MKILDQKEIIGIAALLVHAAKIDEQYSKKKKTLIKLYRRQNERSKCFRIYKRKRSRICRS